MTRFRLSAETRSRLRSDIDLDALEGLLALLDERAHEVILGAFAKTGTEGSYVAEKTQGSHKIILVPQPSDICFDDPTLQAMLEKACKPMISNPPPDANVSE